MNKKELISALADASGKSKKEAGEMLDTFVQVVSDTLSKDEEVKLVGFGTFSVVERKARKGVNPLTKEAIDIPATKVPKFKAGNDLKEKVK
jgi:DNA-binding protein HU-beta